MRFKPRPYQNLIVDYIIEHPRCAIHADMGMGKTSACLHTISILKLLEGDVKALIVAPLRVAEHVWPSEVQAWDDFKHLKVSVISGETSIEKRKAAVHCDADIYCINYELLPWLVTYALPKRWKWDIIIVDESTRLKSFRRSQGSKRAKALAKHCYKAKRLIELTGTPMPNGLKDLWGQVWFIDYGARLGNTFTAFTNRWFYFKDRYSFSPIPFPHSQKEITERISDVCLSIRAKDWLPIKDPIVVDVPVTMPKAAMDKYLQMEKLLYLELEKGDVDAKNEGSKLVKCMQIANGAIYIEGDYQYEEIHQAKFYGLDSIINESGGCPLLLCYNFRSDFLRLKRKYSYAWDINDKGAIEAWNKGDVPLLLVHPASAGHGLNLQHGGNRVVFFGHSWDLELYLQVVERIGPTRQFQSGYDRPVYIYNIRTVDTVDSRVIKSRTDKRSAQDILREALR